MRTATICAFLLSLLSVMLSPSVVQAEIEAVEGKRYRLTKKHGPWMIMVATFREPPKEMAAPGKGPTQAAEELVYELRQKGIPAYSFRRDESKKLIKTVDRAGREIDRKYRLNEEICVIAGNYGSIDQSDSDGKRAQGTLDWIKRYQPKCFGKEGIYVRTPGNPGPLAGAFLTVNPLLTPEELAHRKKDPLILQLNSGLEYSLLKNEGKYTVIVASFYGKSVTKANEGALSKALSKFKVTDGLDQAGLDAWRLTEVLRDKKVEAYCYNDRHKSIVTVGSFDSPNDPQIAEVQRMYGAQWKPSKETGKPILVSEVITLPTDNAQGQQMFVFDPQPRVFEVPQQYRR